MDTVLCAGVSAEQATRCDRNLQAHHSRNEQTQISSFSRFMCMSICLYVYILCLPDPWRSGEDVGHSEIEVTDTTTCVLETKPGPLEEQQVLLTAGLSL